MYVYVWYFVKYQICCCWHTCTLLTLGGEKDLFGYSFLPSSLIFASIGEMQHSFSMEHAVFHLSDISSASGNCVVTHPLHPFKDNIMRGSEIACLTYYLSKLLYCLYCKSISLLHQGKCITLLFLLLGKSFLKYGYKCPLSWKIFKIFRKSHINFIIPMPYILLNHMK